MSAHDHLHPRQFGRTQKKDPGEQQKPKFSGGDASKTMRVERGKGLKRPPRAHLHRRHAAARTRRAH